MSPTVLVFRADLLPSSETFIAAQAHALRRFSPCFVGLHPLATGLPLDPCNAVLLTSTETIAGKLRRRLFVETGIMTSNFLRDLRHRRPVLLHAHFAVDAAIALPVQRKLHLPLIVTLHGYDVTLTPQALRRSVTGRVFLRRQPQLRARAGYFICVSEHIRRQALERGVPEARIRSLPIGVDLDFFIPDARRTRDPMLLFVGRLVEKKGCTHLIRAMSLLQERRPEAKLVIIGDGPLMDSLQLQARASVRHFTFLGSQSPAVVRDFMYRATLLAAPSVVAPTGDTEGLPITLCEAQAIGLPIVGFRGPGVAEAVVENETALLVAAGDHMALADAMCGVLENPQLAGRLAAAGRRRAEAHFSLAAQTARLEDLYAEAIACANC